MGLYRADRQTAEGYSNAFGFLIQKGGATFG
jgi:hypothetical protein